MVSIFFYRGGILLKSSVPEKQKITCIWHRDNCLKPLCEQWQNLHKNTGLKNLIFYQENVRSHFGVDPKIFYEENSIKILKHPLYSPDLSLCNFWLFPKIKNCQED